MDGGVVRKARKKGYVSGKRREKMWIGGMLHLRCWCEEHQGRWLPEEDFTLTRYRVSTGEERRIRKARCAKACAREEGERRRPDKKHRGKVPLSRVQPWIWQVVHLCGGFNAAARTFGVSPPTIYRWLQRYNMYSNNKYVYAETAALILGTLRGIRLGEVEVQKNPRPDAKVNYRYGCVGCGGPLELYSPGCKTCWERKAAKEWRSKQKLDEAGCVP